MTYLADNDDDANYFYLVTVLTGLKNRAGTNADISISVVGEDGTSDKHVLMDQNEQLFKTGSEDWFILAETCSLGRLRCVALSIDYSNTQRYWYVRAATKRKGHCNRVETDKRDQRNPVLYKY